ncbi:helix-turn-helix domain-containing protein [Pseudoclavibacter sp. AY1H1]|uniref:helix-turn-helix domain-containing protein n=1 Tax=Pseudoclavibacter sp. AY1H1 TaxID=2080584 RepID=UPI000CE81D1F|nr:hypothetical protein [Pseudoclavibacter sp. AY1H1]PPF38376.1 hypothetical protein C5E05_05020 [Pseudoclavibacter sp. AY1H1]
MQTGNDAAAQAIRLLLAAHDKNQSWLAAQLGKSPFWIGRRMSHTVNFDLEDLGKIAAVFGLDIPGLLAVPEAVAASTMKAVAS